MVYNHTGYDVNMYFGSEVIAKKCRKYNFHQFQIEFHKNSSNKRVAEACRRTAPTESKVILDITSPAVLRLLNIYQKF